MSEGFVAGLAKVVAVGGLMAAAAGGIYLVASTNSGDDVRDRVQVEGTATTTEATTTGGTSSPAETATPATDVTSALTTQPTVAGSTMSIRGTAWIDARAAFANVEAFIGPTRCAEATASFLPDVYDSSFGIDVPSEQAITGCGYPGADVRFTLDGRPAGATVEWQPGLSTHVELVAGPAFGRYRGSVALPELRGDMEVQPLIDAKVCGVQLNQFQGTGPSYVYVVSVDAEDLTSGCGRPGTVVEFRLISRDENGNTIVLADLGRDAWSPGTTVQRSAMP